MTGNFVSDLCITQAVIQIRQTLALMANQYDMVAISQTVFMSVMWCINFPLDICLIRASHLK